ncbi:MAG: hypothetical protein FJ340_05560, partial [Sphingomonadales bacterium]|nr:hypothetical protein [Sphingomonadales bacterium]
MQTLSNQLKANLFLVTARKKSSLLFLTLTLAVLFVGNGVKGQSSSNYTFSTNATGSLALDANSNAVDMTTGTTTLLSGGSDFGVSSVTNIPFTFIFMGRPFSQFSATADGMLNLGATANSGTTLTASGASATTPRISAFGGDLYLGSSGKIHSKVVGSAPNRCLIVEWNSVALFFSATAANANSTWQVRLYETTGMVEFVYGAMNIADTYFAPGYIGFATNTIAAAGNILCINSSTNAVQSTSAQVNSINGGTYSTGDITNLNSSSNGSRRIYSLTPPSAPPNDPTSLSITGGTTTATLRWTDNSTNEALFIITRATNASFTENTSVSTVASTTSATTGGSYSSTLTNLEPGTTYYFRVQSSREGVVSTGISGSLTTTSATTYYWVGATGGTWSAAGNWNTNPAGGGSTRLSAATTDVLIIDGAGTTSGGTLSISVDVTSFSIGQFKITNSTALTLQSSSSTARVITITGGMGDDFVIGSGSALSLNSSNPVGFIFSSTGVGLVGTISGTLNFGGSTSNLVTTTGGTGTLVSIESSGIVNLTSTTVALVGSTSTLLFKNGSTCNSSGATTGAPPVPLSAWETNSNLVITGITSSTTRPTNNLQSFGNLTYNCPSATGTMSFFTTSTSAVVKGNLNIIATNTGKFRALTSGTLTIQGNINVSGGTFDVASSNGVLNVAGNISVTGGAFDIAQGELAASSLNLQGNFIQTGGTVTQTSSMGQLQLNGVALQSLTLGTHGGSLRFRINNAAGVNLTSNISIRDLTVSAGNITGTGTISYNGTSSILTYNGSTGSQTANAIEFPSSNGPSSLVINNTSTSPTNVVTIPFARTLNGTSGILTLTSGIVDNSGGSNALTLSNSGLGAISGGSQTTYIKGAISRPLPAGLTSSDYSFPLGKATFNPITLTSVSTLTPTGAVTITAEVFDANSGGSAGTNMSTLNTNRYWAVSSSGPLSGTLITLNDNSVTATTAIASSSTLTGAYNLVGGTSPLIASGISITTAAPALTSLPGFFVLGEKAVPMVYVSSSVTGTTTAPIIKPATNQQIIRVQVLTSGNGSPLTVSGLVFTTTGSTSPTIDISAAKVFYTGASATFSTTTQFGSTISSPSGNFTISGTQILSEGTNYFWLVYDVPAGATENNLVGGTFSSISYTGGTSTPTDNSATGARVIRSALNGVYNIAPGLSFPHYTTLTAAIADLHLVGVSGPVTFLLQTTYTSTTETFPLVINEFTGSSLTNTLTIKPQTTATLSGSSSTALITLKGADNVIIDGSNNGTSSRDLTIINNNTGTSSAVVWLQSNGTNGATSNIIKNCNIVGNAPTTTLVGVGSGSSSISATSLGTNNNNNTFQNNNISKVQYAIYSQGNSSGTKNSGNVITQNLINAASPNQVSKSGILVGFENNVTISNNNISNISGVSSSHAWAINLGAIISISTTPPTSGNEVTNATVSANLIGSIRGANQYGAGGILVSPSTSGINLIVNNMISGVAANGTGGDCGIGIMVAGGSGSTTRVYHNSVAMSATLTGGSGPNIALAVSNNPTIDIKNNILASTGSTGTGANRAIALSYSAYTNLTSNYNDLFVSGGGTTAGVGAIGGWAGTAQVALSNWQTTTSQDVNSLSIVPPFVSATDLHLSTGTTPTRFESRGVLTSVTTDIDGQVRPGPAGSTNGGGTAPDIGADEFDGVPIPGCVTPTAQPTGLVLTPATSSISLSFTPAAGTPSHYLIIRYTGATISTTTPVNGTTYTNGTSALGGTVVANSTTSTVNDAGPLSPTTQYTYAIYSYNNSNCDGGPIYLTASPLTGTTTTCGNAAPSSAAATAVLATSFVANWTAVTGSTGYLLDISTSSTFSSFVTGYNSLAVSSSSLSLTVTGLTPLTTYYYRVRSQEGTCVSTNSGNITVTTYASVPWSEGFTGSTATPAGWITTGWTIGDYYDNDYWSFWPYQTGNPMNAILKNIYSSSTGGGFTLPTFAAIPSNVSLNYQYNLTDYDGVSTVAAGWGSLQWQISINGGAFTNLGGPITATTGSSYVNAPTIDLSSYTGQNIQLRLNATWLSGDYFLSFDNFNIFPPCTVPASPTGLTQSSSGLASIALGFTHPGTAPSSYLVVRYPAGSTPTSPVTGTTYAVNGTLGSGVVTHIITGTSTPTFTLSNLNAGTSYDVYVYPYNNTNCSPAPLYGGPLSGTFTTVSCAANPLVGSYSIPGSYASLTAAISDLNVRGVSGNVFLQLGSAYTSTVETFPLTLASNPCMNASNTVTIRPAAGVSGLSITSGNATATIDVNGGDYWVVDGRPGSVGTTAQLSLINSSNAPAIRFINDATNNIVRFSNVSSSVTSTNSGIIVFSNTSGTSGNDNNIIDNCDLNGGGVAPNIIYASGSTSPADNSGNTISNNLIRDQFAAASETNGILVLSGNTSWTIGGNSIYQTLTRTFTSGSTHTGIKIDATAGNGFTITNNFIGGSAANCGSTAWTISGTIANRFRGISLNVGTATATSVQGNTIANFNFTSNSSSTANGGPWTGIILRAGNANIGTLAGNSIGSASSQGSIVLAVVSNSGSRSSGIFCDATTTSSTIANNSIGSITFNASSISQGFVGIATTGGGTLTVTGNVIGSGTITHSIDVNTGATSTTGQIVTGILNTGAATIAITNNIIANLKNNYLPSAAYSTQYILAGINTSGSGPCTISGNVIRNLSTSANATGTTTSASVIGIGVSSTSSSHTISQNQIFSLSNTNTTAATVVSGIQFTGGGSNVVERNFIYNLSSSTSSSSAEINGIRVGGGTTLYRNNVIALGGGVANSIGAAASNSSVAGINGINGPLGTDEFFHNSVYIGGTATSGSGASYAFNGTHTTSVRSFRNNIFVNARSNSGTATGKHYAIKLNGTTTNPTGLTVNNNIYFASGSGSVLGYYNSLDVNTLVAWQTAVGQDVASYEANPQFIDPTASVPDLHISASVPTLAEATGAPIATVTDDFDGQTRSGLSPVDIGADAGNFVAIAPQFSNLVPVPSLTVQCSASQRSISVDITTSSGSISSAILNYSFNGGTASSITMTNSAGNTWAAIIPAATPVNAQVTWTIVATNSIGIASTYNGASYADVPTLGILTTATASPTAICQGTTTTLSVLFGATVTATYCAPVAASSSSSYFNVFSTSGGTTNINNTASGFSSNGYGDFTSMVVEANRGQVINFNTSLVGTTVGVSIWVDWDQDGVFSTAEKVYGTSSYVSTSSGAFTVPSTAPYGTRRMRVLMDYNSTAPSNPCGPFVLGRGEVEDYTFSVAVPVTAVSWSNGTSVVGTTNTLTITPTVGTLSYTATATIGGCPLVASPVAVTVNPLPAITAITGTASVCAGSTTTLTSTTSGGVWTTSNAAVAAISSAGTVTGVTAGNATITYTVTNPTTGCTNSVTRQVTVNALPVVSAISGTTSVCVGLTTTLTSTPTTGVWSSANTAIATVSSTGVVSGIAAGSVTISYTVTNSNNCVTIVTRVVTVNPLPVVPAITGASSVCMNSSVTLANTTPNGVWTTSNSAVASVSSSGVVTGIAGGTAIITYTVTSSSGCVTAVSTVVTVNILPSVTGVLTQPTTCVTENGAINITAGGPAAGPYTYAWSTPNGSTPVATAEDQTGLLVGQYDVVVTAANGCSVTGSYTLVGPGGCDICPTISTIAASPNPPCVGSNTTLTASGLIDMGVTFGIAFKYSTTPLTNPYTQGTVIQTVPNSSLTGSGTQAATTISFPAPGTYYVYSIVTPLPLSPNCRPFKSATITVEALPTVSAVSNQIVSSSTSTTPVVFSGGGVSATYSWTNSNTAVYPFSGGSGNISAFFVTNTGTSPQTSTIAVSATNPNSAGQACTGPASNFTVTVNPAPTMVQPTNYTFVNAVSSTAINFATVNTGGTTTYAWTNSNAAIGLAASGTGSIPVFTPVNTGTSPITVTISVTPSYTNANGGPTSVGAKRDFTITINPTAQVNTVANQFICTGASVPATVFATANTGGTTTYAWTNDNPAIGLAASGTGSLPAYTATNTQAGAISATITVTPTYTNAGLSTSGAAATFVITVNPVGQVNTVLSQALCTGSTTTAVNFSTTNLQGNSVPGSAAITSGT